MKYAVVESGGKQYKVSEGTILEVERLHEKDESNFTFEKVLLFAVDDDIKIGKPYLKNITISAKVLEQKKGPKIRVAKFKAKARFRKVQGHRQSLTKVKITKIASDSTTKKT